uniref:Coilin N-terminal domain-containing protein n=1 Tax=Colobus angolensis palliatus TaxID=336983 RepID=A0A2K5IAT8_COLAP
MAASETVRLRLQFDYPPPATPHCTAFWLLVDLNNLTSLIHQRFSCSSGALLGLYLERGLLPRAESVRLVRDNNCLRVKLEERGVAENSKSKKRAFQLEDEETEPDYKYSKKHRERQENNNNNEKVLDLEPKAVTDQTVKKNKATCGTAGDDNKETKRKSAKNPKSPEVQAVKDWAIQRCSSPKGSARNSLLKPKGKVSPSSFSEPESCDESISDGPSKVTLEARNSSEKLPTELSKEGPSTKNTTADKLGIKSGFSLTPSKDKTSGTSSISDCSSESDDQCLMSASTLECAAGFLKAVGLFAGRGCPGPELSSHTAGAAGWRHSGSNGDGQTPGPSPSVSLPTSLGRRWGRGENLFSWKGARGRGMRGRGHPVSCIGNRSTDNQRQQQLSDVVTNSSIIQNPVKTHKKDYTAAPQVGEKIAFKLLELTSRRILSPNPKTQQVDTEILPSLPALREPGKFDLVYHNENGTELVEYSVTQESKITVFWRELIDPRLIIESPSNTSSTEPA